MFLKYILMSLALSTAVSVYGTAVDRNTNGKYLEDVIIINASSTAEAKAKAENLDYVLMDGTLDTYGTNGKYVACKYTTNKEDALTDIRAMNMLGGFSSEAYQKAMEDKKDETRAIIDNLYDSVLALKNNYTTSKNNKSTNGVDGVIYSYDLLNYYSYDDLNNPTTNSSYTIAELLTSSLNEETLKEHLTTIFMQGNAEYVSSIEKGLMHAATSQNDALDLEELASEDMDYNDYDDPSYEIPAAYIAAGVENIQEYLRPFVNSNYNCLDDKKGNEEYSDSAIESYLKNADTETQTDFVDGYFVYVALSSYSYHHDGITENLADFFMNLDTDAEDFDNKIFYPFVAGMNNAQIGCLPYAGIDTLITASIYKKFTNLNHKENKNYAFNYDTLETTLFDKADSTIKVSVFDGVDRSVFKAEGVALTNNALRQNNSKNDFNWFSEENKVYEKVANVAKMVALCAGITAVAAGSCWTATYVIVTGAVMPTIETMCPDLVGYGISKLGRILLTRIYFVETGEFTYDAMFSGSKIGICVARSLGKIATIGYKVMVVFATVALVAIALCIMAYIIYEIFDSLSKRDPEYIDIPEIMVDEEVVNDKAVYSYYYAVSDENGKPQSTTFYEENKETQWVALYKTNDPERGNPILAKDLRLAGYTGREYRDEFTSVRKFGETSEYNILTFKGDGNNKLYLGYKNLETTNTASVFANGVGLAIIFLVAGLALGAVGGIFTYKFSLKRKKESI